MIYDISLRKFANVWFNSWIFHTCALYSENGADVLKDSKFWSGVKTTKLDMLALRRTFEQTQTNKTVTCLTICQD